MNTVCISLIFSFFITHALAHEGEEASVPVGPDQGVIAFEKDQGFKLSSEAIKRFRLQSVSVASFPVELPTTAVVSTLKEKNLFRIRQGFLMRIDFKEINRTGNKIRISSPSLKPGDEVVTAGIGFLRIVEIGLGSSEHQDSHSDENEEHHHD